MEPQQRIEPPPEDRENSADYAPHFRAGVGEILRHRRESYGQDLPTVAAQLHIRLTYLRAVESGRFKDLPGMAYASGFVRSYGDYLGLDGEELVRLFREEMAGVDRQVPLNVPIVAASEGRIPGGAILLLSGFLALLAYGAWYYLNDRHKSFLDMVPEVPSQLRAILGKEVPTNVTTAPPMVKPQSLGATAQGGAQGTGAQGTGARGTGTATPGAAAQGSGAPGSAPSLGTASQGGAAITLGAAPAPSSTATAAGATPSAAASQHTTATAPSVDAPAEPPVPPATSVLVAPEDLPPSPGEFDSLMAARRPPQPDGQPAPPPAQVVMSNPGARVKLVARMDSWVQINDKTGKTYYSAVLRAGQAIEVPNQPGLLLTAGNAGGLDILVDGSPTPSLGAVGLVKRDLPLDPAGLKTTKTTQ